MQRDGRGGAETCTAMVAKTRFFAHPGIAQHTMQHQASSLPPQFWLDFVKSVERRPRQPALHLNQIKYTAPHPNDELVDAQVSPTHRALCFRQQLCALGAIAPATALTSAPAIALGEALYRFCHLSPGPTVSRGTLLKLHRSLAGGPDPSLGTHTGAVDVVVYPVRPPL